MISSFQNGVFQIRSWKTLLPQLQSSLVAILFDMIAVMSFSYSGILIPEIEKPETNINTTLDQLSWLASATPLTMAFSGIFTGFLIDNLGRLNTLRLSIIPGLIGWSVIALASNFTMLLIGRIMLGIAIMICIQPSGIYIGETTWPNVRSTFLMLMAISCAIGNQLLYLERLFFNWRQIAWSCIAYHVLAVALTFSIPESPSWLVHKGKINKARRALEWFHKNQPLNEDQRNSDIHLGICMKEDYQQKENAMKNKNMFNIFFKSRVYKPILICYCLFFVQQFSGHHVMQAFTITFFQKIGSSIDPVVIANIVNGMTIVVSFVSVPLAQIVGRRRLLLISSLGAGACLTISGFLTLCYQGANSKQWISVVFVFLYMAMMNVGLGPLPWMISCEILPLEVRGIASSFLLTGSTSTMFAAIHSYLYLDVFLGSAGVQFLYSTVAIFGSIIIHFILPETKGRSLFEIENYFK